MQLVSALKDAEILKTKELSAEEMKAALIRKGYSESIAEEVLATQASTIAKNVETEANVANTISENDNTEANVKNASSNEIEAVSTKKSTAAKLSKTAFGSKIAGAAGGAKAILAGEAGVIAAAAGWITIIAGISIAIYKIYDALTVSKKEADEAAKEASEKYKSVKTDLESLGSQIDEINNKIKDLNSKDHLTLTDKDELKTLKQENEELERQYAIQEKIVESAKENANKTAKDALNSKSLNISAEYSSELPDNNFDAFWNKRYIVVNKETESEQLLRNINLIKTYQNAVDELEKKQLSSNNNKELDFLQNQIEKYNNAISKLESESAEHANNIQEQLSNIIDKDSEVYKNNYKILNDYLYKDVTGYQKTKKILDDYFSNIDSTGSFKELLSESNNYNETLNKLGLTIDDLGVSTNELHDYFNDLKVSINDANEVAEKVGGTLSDIKTAFDNENSSTDWTSLAGYLADAKKLYDGGFIGTDDFQTVAQWMSPKDIDTSAYEIPANAYVDAWKNAYDKVSRWFNSEDQTASIWNFWEDLKNANSELVDIDKSTGLIQTHFTTTQEAADALGVSANMVETILKTMSDYGFKFDGITKTSEELSNIKSNMSSIQDEFNNLEEGSRKDRLGGLLDTWNEKVTGFENDMSTLEDGFSIPIEFEYDLQQIYDAIDELKNSMKYGNENREGYAQVLGYNEKAIGMLENNTGITNIANVYVDALQKGIDDATNNLQNKIKSGDYTDDEIVELQKLIDEQQSNYQSLMKSFNDWSNNKGFSIDTSSIDDVKKYWDEYFSEPQTLYIDAKLDDSSDLDNINQLLNGLGANSVVTFTADIDGVTQAVSAVKNEDGTIYYTGDVSDAEAKVRIVRNQDGQITFSGDTNPARRSVRELQTDVEKSRTYLPVNANTSFARNAVNILINAINTARGVIPIGIDMSEAVRKWNTFALKLNSISIFGLSTKLPIFSSDLSTTWTSSGGGTHGGGGKSFGDSSSSSHGGGGRVIDVGNSTTASYLPTGNTGQGNLISNSSKDNSGSGSGSGSGSDSEKDPTEFNLIEIAIDRVQKAVDKLSKTASSVYKTWGTRNNALAQQVSKVTEEINLQQQAYNKYMQLANGVGLSESYASLIRNGKMDIISVADEDLADKISKYKDFYEKALECSIAIDDLKENLSELAKTKFDNINTQFEEQISLIEHANDMYEGYVDQLEKKGYLASTKYYDALISTEKKNISALQSKYNGLARALEDALNSGTIVRESEAWYEMVSSINDVEKAIQDANSALIEYQNTLRQTQWDIFDKAEDYVSKIQDESNFIIDLMSSNNLYEDNGDFNKFGQATAGLHAVNYNAYMAQADAYANEIKNIDKEIANDPYNTTLIERRQELLSLQQDSIKNAESEKQSIKSLVSDGYNKLLESLQKLIDKYKDAMQQQKDLYDYQKEISEKTKNIAALQKQQLALKNDTSEENQSKQQQLSVSLQDAKDDLEQTEYEKYLSDQEKLLDDLYDKAEEWVNSRLDDLDSVIREVIESTNNNALTIQQTISTEVANVGSTLSNSMNTIWTTNTDSMKQVVSMYGDKFTNYSGSFDAYAKNTNTGFSNVVTAINNVYGMVKAMKDKSEAEAAKAIQATTATATKVTSSTPSSGTSGSSSSSNAKPATSASSSSSSSKWGSWFVSKKDSYPKNKLQVD